jgi:hypothetical protein
VFIRTDYDYLENKSGKRFLIGPGMIATVDIKTGEKRSWIIWSNRLIGQKKP